jgi:hypothetical protein
MSGGAVQAIIVMAVLLFLAALLCIPVVGVILLGLFLPFIAIPLIIGLVLSAANIVFPNRNSHK